MAVLADGIRKKESADKYCKMLLEQLAKVAFTEFYDPGPENLWISERKACTSSYYRQRSTLYRVEISYEFHRLLQEHNLHRYPYISRLHNVRPKKETPHAATERARLAAVAIREAGAGGQGGFQARPGGIIEGEHEEATIAPGQYTTTITGIDHATRTVTLRPMLTLEQAMHIPDDDWDEDDDY